MRHTPLTILSILLMVMNFWGATIAAAPVDYGLDVLWGRYIALLVGGVGIVLSFLPQPRRPPKG